MNLIALKRRATDLAAELRSVRRQIRKLSNPTRVFSDKMEEAMLYREFRTENLHCWACHSSFDQCPPWWMAPWVPNERAHVVNQTRIESVKVIVSLCTSCHYLAHGNRIAGCDLPNLTQSHLLYLLMENGTADFAFLRRHNGTKPLPKAEPLPVGFMRLRERNER